MDHSNENLKAGTARKLQAWIDLLSVLKATMIDSNSASFVRSDGTK